MRKTLSMVAALGAALFAVSTTAPAETGASVDALDAPSSMICLDMIAPDLSASPSIAGLTSLVAGHDCGNVDASLDAVTAETAFAGATRSTAAIPTSRSVYSHAILKAGHAHAPPAPGWRL